MKGTFTVGEFQPMNALYLSEVLKKKTSFIIATFDLSVTSVTKKISEN
jgi:hypothetical protein